MTSLNNMNFDKPNAEPQILIELPEPKPITDTCTIIMNGHHNFGSAEDCIDETDPFLNKEASQAPSMTSSTSVGSTVVSANHFPAKESTVASSGEDESDADAEQESSTHLLQKDKIESPSIKCVKNKPKIPSFKSSPSKRQPSNDSHSHIQHQPLGLPQSTKPCHFYQKWNWNFVQLACLGFSVFLVIGITCIAVGLYFTSSTDCGTSDMWWNNNIIYEIFPASFQDTDGDGYGDIRGIIERLDYIQNLSINVIRLNSIFSALDYPLEYEHIIDFANIDPHIGRIEDFEDLIKDVHSRGMYIILDMNPTVTSDQHTWALHWVLNRPGRYEKFYVNVSDDEEEPPLETRIEYTENGWPPPHRTFGEKFFLNWSSPLVQLEMRSVLDVWLSMGIDGFYIKHIENMHINDRNDYVTIINQWRYVLDLYSVNTTRKVLMMSHGNLEFLNSIMDPVRYIDIPTMIDLVDSSIKIATNGSVLSVGEDVEVVRKFWGNYHNCPVIIWHVGSAETLRLADEVGRAATLASFLFMSFLPGSMSCFYGDEIGLMNSYNLETKKVYRGGQFTPMQWSCGPQSNFSSDDYKTWIPVHPSYTKINVDSEQEKLQFFQTLVELKRNGELFPSHQKHSLVHSFMNRLTNHLASTIQYQWYHNLCGLIVVKTIHNEFEYIYIGNFGQEALSFTDEEECVGGNFVFSVYPWKQVDVIISTNTAVKGTSELKQLLLEPGDSLIGRLVT